MPKEYQRGVKPARTETPQDQIASKLGWYACPAEIDLDRRLTIYEKAVLHNFMAHANRKTGACFPSRDLQAKEIGCSTNKVTDCRASLIEKGYLIKAAVYSAKGKLERFNWGILMPDPLMTTQQPPPVDQASGTPDDVASGPPVDQASANQRNRTTGKEPSASPAKAGVADAAPKVKSDPNEPMDQKAFTAWCAKSKERHINIIGEWADTVRPDFTTRGQWGTFMKRYLRPAKMLVPFNDAQIIEAYQRIMDARDDKRGFLTDPTLETVIKYLTK